VPITELMQRKRSSCWHSKYHVTYRTWFWDVVTSPFLRSSTRRSFGLLDVGFSKNDIAPQTNTILQFSSLRQASPSSQLPFHNSQDESTWPSILALQLGSHPKTRHWLFRMAHAGPQQPVPPFASFVVPSLAARLLHHGP
jgi:hypothetical protein